MRKLTKLTPARGKGGLDNEDSSNPKSGSKASATSAGANLVNQYRLNGRYATTTDSTLKVAKDKNSSSEQANHLEAGVLSRSQQFSSIQSVIDENKIAKLNNKRLRLATELDAALLMHKAGIECWVKKSVVCAVRGWSRATLYRRIATNDFPKPRKRNRSSEWRIADVIAN